MGNSSSSLIQENFAFQDAAPCKVCKGITIKNLSSQLGYTHQDDFESLLESAEAGCNLCLLIRDAIMRVAGGNLVRENFSTKELLQWHSISCLVTGNITLRWRENIGFGQNTYRLHHYVKEDLFKSVQICITWDRKKGDLILDEELKGFGMATLSLYVDRDGCMAASYPGRRIPIDLRGQQDFENLVVWTKALLMESDFQHQITILPTRLIDVKQPNDPDVVLVRTIAGYRKQEPVDHDAKYIALSHCWGNGVPLEGRLLCSNWSDRHESIKIDSLTPNFQDAIVFTRALRMQYLWIDALCIIQDSSSDWEREAAQMGDYYKNSWLTISAGMTKDGQKGLFGERLAPFDPMCRLMTLPSFLTPSYALFFAFDPLEPPSKSMLNRLRGTQGPRIEDDSAKERILFEPKREYLQSLQSALLSRAWVLQEDLLSRRQISFEPSQVYFRCDDFVEFESGHREKLDTDNYVSMGRSSLLSGDWEQIVREYSVRDLTKPKDKLIALHGLAGEYYELHQDEYFAGIWKKSFLKGLLWERPYGVADGVCSRPPDYRAPTWSWAAVKGPVQHRLFTESERKWTKVLNVKVEPSSDGVGVSGGSLTARGMFVAHFRVSPVQATARVFSVPNVSNKDIAASCNLDVRPPGWAGDKQFSILFITDMEGLLLEPVPNKRLVFKRVGMYQGMLSDLLDKGPAYCTVTIL